MRARWRRVTTRASLLTMIAVSANADGKLRANEIAAAGGKTFTLGHDVIAQ